MYFEIFLFNFWIRKSYISWLSVHLAESPTSPRNFDNTVEHYVICMYITLCHIYVCMFAPQPPKINLFSARTKFQLFLKSSTRQMPNYFLIDHLCTQIAKIYGTNIVVTSNLL